MPQYCATNGLKCMSWPSQSPDLNIIENVRLFIKRKLQTLVLNIKTSQDLFKEILRTWQCIEPEYIQSLSKSIPKRIQNVIWLKGHLTKYWGKNLFKSSYSVFVMSPWKADKFSEVSNMAAIVMNTSVHLLYMMLQVPLSPLY